MEPTLSRSSRSSRGNITVSYECRFPHFPEYCHENQYPKHHWYYESYSTMWILILSLCVSISVSSQGSSLWESVPAGYTAVGASLLSDSDPMEASLWSSVQPNYVWASKGTCVHNHFSCNCRCSYIITAVFIHMPSWMWYLPVLTRCTVWTLHCSCSSHCSLCHNFLCL